MAYALRALAGLLGRLRYRPLAPEALRRRRRPLGLQGQGELLRLVLGVVVPERLIVDREEDAQVQQGLRFSADAIPENYARQPADAADGDLALGIHPLGCPSAV